MVLADYLTRKGFAVLRADDRGIGGSSGNIFESTMEDFARDALAGFEFLKQQSQINPKQIGFIGNSEGTLVGPMAAAINKETAFIITLGGMGISGAEVIMDQVKALGTIGNMEAWEIEVLKQRTQKIFDLLGSKKNKTDYRKC
jgi:alpha/beta superfamily hydrolase